MKAGDVNLIEFTTEETESARARLENRNAKRRERHSKQKDQINSKRRERYAKIKDS